MFVLIAVVDISNEQDKEGETHTSSFLDVPINRDLVGAPLFTVLLSVFAHGLSAAPMVKALAAGLAKKRRAGTVAQVQAMDVWDVKNTHIRPRRGYSARYPGPPATTRAAVDAVGSTGAVGDVPRMGAGSLPGDTTSCEELERGLQLGRRSFSQNSLNVHCLDGNLGDLNCDDVEIGTPRSASEKTL